MPRGDPKNILNNLSAIGNRLAALLALTLPLSGHAQTQTYVVDQFNPAGTGGFSYVGGEINGVWANWFGGAFQSATWDPTSDASGDPNSGSLEITANFSAANNQYEIYDGLNGINPPLNGLLYTNFQCDVRFAPGSATVTNNGLVSFGHLQFGIATATYGQDYFGGLDVPATNTGWVHVSLPLDAVADTNLATLSDVLIHIYGPYYGSGLTGASTLRVDNVEFTGPAPVTAGLCLVDGNTVYQRIDGFGASSAWESSWTTAAADLLFSTNNGVVYTDDLNTTTTNNGIGLSLLRNHIVPAGSTAAGDLPTTDEIGIMQMAQARGARVWSTPWTPAAGFKSNDNADGGGFVGTTAHYQAYAGQLANYVASLKKTHGINLYAISLQNEPDAQVNTYESCNWTAQQIHDFIPNLYAALVSQNVAATLIMLPESQNWQDYSNLAVTAMNDPAVAADVGIVADHNYDGADGPASLAKNSYGKALWESEVSLLTGSDSSITNGVYWAQRIYQFMTNNVNAYHYWWLASGNSAGNEGLLDNNAALTKRLFAFGQYSRFVRPGYHRIGANNATEALLTAYQDPHSGNFAIVAVNPDPVAAISQTITLTNFPPVSSVTPWITSANLSLAGQPALSVTNTSFTCTLPPLSVVTFAGQAAAPTLVPVANRTINAGTTLIITNVGADAAAPAPVLTFTLLDAPTNAALTTVNGTNGVFTWRPLVRQAGTTNPVSVRVAVSADPNLSATNLFTLTVNPFVPPGFSSITVATRRVTLTIEGPQGPDYTLLTSTNLLTWQTLLATNAPAMPLLLTDPNPVGAAQYYRIQSGP
jgi:glucuronoarabinoxylan endo-1,4-beta-xylanase